MQGGVQSESAPPTCAGAAPQVQLKSARLTSQDHRCIIRVGAWRVVNPEQDVARHHTSSLGEALWIEICHEHTKLLFYRFQSAQGTRGSMRVWTHARRVTGRLTLFR